MAVAVEGFDLMMTCSICVCACLSKENGHQVYTCRLAVHGLSGTQCTDVLTHTDWLECRHMQMAEPLWLDAYSFSGSRNHYDHMESHVQTS